MTIDLDAARRARAEVQGEAETLVFGGETFQLPAELPYMFAESAQKGEWRDALTSLLNGSATRFFELNPTIKDLEVLTEGIAKSYTGTEAGESSASRASSKKTTKRVRQPSSATTAKR